MTEEEQAWGGGPVSEEHAKVYARAKYLLEERERRILRLGPGLAAKQEALDAYKIYHPSLRQRVINWFRGE